MFYLQKEDGAVKILATYSRDLPAEPVIPESVTTIKSAAFSGCAVLTEIHLPKNLSGLSNYIFNDCKAPVKIVYSGTRQEWDAIFKGMYWYAGLGGRKVELICSDGKYAYNI